MNANNGASVWNLSICYGLCIQASPSFSNGIVYTGSSFDYKIYALAVTDASVLWSYPTGGGIFCAPAVVGKIVYVISSDNSTYALNAETGDLIWKCQTEGYLFVACGSGWSIVRRFLRR